MVRTRSPKFANQKIYVTTQVIGVRVQNCPAFGRSCGCCAAILESDPKNPRPCGVASGCQPRRGWLETGAYFRYVRISRRAPQRRITACLLYTSDAADDLLCVD